MFCALLLVTLAACAQASTYASITLSGNSKANASRVERVSYQTSSLYSVFGNLTRISGTPVYQFRSSSTFVEGCDLLTPPSGVGQRPWIAIVQRGTCTYFNKATNAALAGAAGVIVVDNVITSVPVLMYSSYTEPKSATVIVSVSFTYNAALEMIRFIDLHTNVSMVIAPGEETPGEDTVRPSINFMFLNNLVVGVVAIGSFAFCVMFGFYMRSRSRRYGLAADPAHAEHLREAREVLLRLPTRAFVAAENGAASGDDAPCCAVCLEDFKDGDLLRILPCKHEMHQPCVDPWLSDHSTCPLCKRDICTTDDTDAQNNAAVAPDVGGAPGEAGVNANGNHMAMNPLPADVRHVPTATVIVVASAYGDHSAPSSPFSPNAPNFDSPDLMPNNSNVTTSTTANTLHMQVLRPASTVICVPGDTDPCSELGPFVSHTDSTAQSTHQPNNSTTTTAATATVVPASSHVHPFTLAPAILAPATFSSSSLPSRSSTSSADALLPTHTRSTPSPTSRHHARVHLEAHRPAPLQAVLVVDDAQVDGQDPSVRQNPLYERHISNC